MTGGLRTIYNSRLVDGEKLDNISVTKPINLDHIATTGDLALKADITYVDSQDSNLRSQINQKEDKSNKGVANGYASLGSDGKVPSSQLPPAGLGIIQTIVGGTNINVNSTDPANPKVSVVDTPTFADVNITGLSGNVITSNSAETSIKELDGALYDMVDSGFVSWSGSGNYYSVDTLAGTFTLLRGGTGRISSKLISFNGSQTISLTNEAATYIGINSSGTLVGYTSISEAQIDSTIFLFEAWRCSAGNILTVKENHPYSFDLQVSKTWHRTIGPIWQSSAIGALSFAKIGTTTGASITDRQIKIVGSGIIEDHGLQTTVSDSAGSAITIRYPYIKADGKWNCYGVLTEIPMVYNNVGTVTALGAGNYGIFKLWSTKDDLNNSQGNFVLTMSSQQYSNLGQAQTAIANDIQGISGTGIINPTNELSLLEFVKTGYVIVQNSGGGYIQSITMELAMAGSGSASGVSSSQASLVTTNTSNFNGILSGADSNVQTALETIDDHTHASQSITFTNKTINGANNTISGLSESTLSLTDITTNNASATKHGFLPKLDNTGTKYLRDDGTWQTISGGDATNNIGYLNIPQNSKSANYTTVLSDSGKHILHPSADTTARTFTIDSNANVPYPVGTALTFINQNAGGAITIAITSDTMRLAGAGTTGSRTLAANGIATAIKVTSTEWIISGINLT